MPMSKMLIRFYLTRTACFTKNGSEMVFQIKFHYNVEQSSQMQWKWNRLLLMILFLCAISFHYPKMNAT